MISCNSFASLIKGISNQQAWGLISQRHCMTTSPTLPQWPQGWAVPCGGAVGAGWNRLFPARGSPSRSSQRPSADSASAPDATCLYHSPNFISHSLSIFCRHYPVKHCCHGMDFSLEELPHILHFLMPSITLTTVSPPSTCRTLVLPLYSRMDFRLKCLCFIVELRGLHV